MIAQFNPLKGVGVCQEFDDGSILLDTDGRLKAYPPLPDETPPIELKWVNSYICDDCHCKIDEPRLIRSDEYMICGDCEFERENPPYYFDDTLPNGDIYQ